MTLRYFAVFVFQCAFHSHPLLLLLFYIRPRNRSHKAFLRILIFFFPPSPRETTNLVWKETPLYKGTGCTEKRPQLRVGLKLVRPFSHEGEGYVWIEKIVALPVSLSL